MITTMLNRNCCLGVGLNAFADLVEPCFGFAAGLRRIGLDPDQALPLNSVDLGAIDEQRRLVADGLHLETIGLARALLQIRNVCLRNGKERLPFAHAIEPDVASWPVTELVVVAVSLYQKTMAMKPELGSGTFITVASTQMAASV